jgi:hypothetical protein
MIGLDASLPAHPPELAQMLVCFAAGPAFEEEIVGDLFEQFQHRRESRVPRALWYWQQVLLSLPALVRMRLQNMTRQDAFFETAFVMLGLVLIWFWETKVAQKFSWPLASNIVDHTSLSAMLMCKAMYIGLYGIALFLAFAGVSLFRLVAGKTQHFMQLHYLFLGIVATTPAILYLIQPNPLGDGTYFRLAQIATIWGLVIMFLVFRPNGRSRHRLSHRLRHNYP